MLRSIIFLKQSQISDYARVRLAVLKIYGIPVRVFIERCQVFPHRLSGKPLIPASGRRKRRHSGASPTPVFDRKADRVRWLAGDNHGRSGARTNDRRQPFDYAHSTLPPARLRLGMPGTTWVFAENTSVIRLIMSILAWVSS